MSSKTLILIGLIVSVGVLGAAIAYFRTASMADPVEIGSKGLSSVRRSSLVFYGVFMPVLFGVISFFVFRFMSARWPVTVESSFLILAVVVAVVFTAMAAVVFKMRGFVELTALHVLYVAGFGWLMPRLLTI
jgi:hypothetical protein